MHSGKLDMASGNLVLAPIGNFTGCFLSRSKSRDSDRCVLPNRFVNSLHSSANN